MSVMSEVGAIVSALLSMESFTIRNALRSDAAWVLGIVVLLIGGYLVAALYRHVPLFERYFERTVMVTMYLAMAFIIFRGVINRFIFQDMSSWSTTVPPLLFMIMAWFGAAYNIRVRTHLSFSEFRTSMPRPAQMACLALDFVLWMGFALILLVTTSRLTALSASNFQIVLGTDNTMQWWFLLTVPLAGILMSARAIENFQDDIRNYRSGQPLIRQAVIGGDN
ncbi:TRAP transporter small permease subunit [Thalassococcus sp. CAU 1522]|uniref:TRAP transporter small permease protein n=1 Tax=Thalassococcus arenae TaxID=2851652 RepID=A0ABS6NCU2_9RHOB|nr:TRAP transporter small permease subunit [Thalassococcus arenae]MBV2361618.1 TRAP transporter small permease subunit [Thalassococcus arenae]